MDTSKAFEIKNAANGGILVLAHRSHPGYLPEVLGAFTTPADMVVWLAKQYDLRIEQIFQEVASPKPGEWHPDVLKSPMGDHPYQWIDFNFETQSVPPFPISTVLEAVYDNKMSKTALADTLDWTRVKRYRVVA